VRALLRASVVIDAINDRFGVIATWLVLIACLVSAGNAFVRYGLNAMLALQHKFPFLPGLEGFIVAYGNNANSFLEAQWYMFAGMVLLGAAYTFKVNEHVRVDLIYGSVSDRTRLLIDIFGIIFFLLPICVILVYFTWPWFLEAYRTGESSQNAGGLVRWPVKLILPVGFALMALQGVSELVKRIAALQSHASLQYQYEKPLQ
jgi:TRAP-type mannitol/chloroaromatic compound transport system permease small subunit